ncbi:hypothetical protein HNY73_011311 [Argiope bruennichi]|uniref:Uncharacterized protein n=1 Tax=Argiope bruennichi TaxID=94029 RepID=A0A8T0F3P2_ARGBR|nr:hypothetical protein HNY73_011311 [Argiope bruennichi]
MEGCKIDRSEWNEQTVILMKRILLDRVSHIYNAEEELRELSCNDGATLFATFDGSYVYLGEVFARIHFQLIYTEYVLKTVREMIITRGHIADAAEAEQHPRNVEHTEVIEEDFLDSKGRMECYMTLIEQIFWKYIREELGL